MQLQTAELHSAHLNRDCLTWTEKSGLCVGKTKCFEEARVCDWAFDHDNIVLWVSFTTRRRPTIDGVVCVWRIFWKREYVTDPNNKLGLLCPVAILFQKSDCMTVRHTNE
jgi:hypothetical protein